MPRNPLDVLAQQIVAMTAMDDWEITALEQTVRRAAPFASLTRPVLEAVLDMLAGRYPERGVRRAAAPAGLGPHHRDAARPAGRPAAGRDQRRDDPRPRPVRRLPGRRPAGPQRPAFPAGRRAGRGDGLRVPGRRRVRARREFLADRGHHRRPGAGLARAGTAGQAPVLARRRARPAGRARPGHRPVLPRARRGQPGRGDGAAAPRRPGRTGRREPGPVPGRAARGDRLPARRQDPGHGAVPGRARRLAAGAAQPVRRPAARPVGAGHRGPAARPVPGHGRAGAAHRRRHRDPGPRRRRPAPGRDRRAGSGRGGAAGDRRARLLGPVRVPVPGVRGPGAAAAPAAAGTPDPAVAAAAALGPAAVGGQPVRRRSRSCSRRSASACRTCSTCPAWPA